MLSILAISMPLIYANDTFAQDEDDLQDMSDPLAVFTQIGAGYTNKGINLKVGQTYDTGKETTAAMNIIELKGIGGEALGWSDTANDSIDSFRFRNFGVDLTNGRGNQIDIAYDLNNESGTASYSLIQALPQYGPLNLYPLAGAGVSFANDADSGYHVPGTFAVVGAYSKLAITDNIWLNYNPMWMTTLSGSQEYMDNGMAGGGNVLTHEFSASYQINPRLNIRYFANWSEHTSLENGDHRIEVNYQL
ncbi:hypothetical protein [Vibrio sp. 10N.261.51.F12]|uniref:hypothetical protein n=1 Tax=Vibrio sp. 10N.261.51.F12 TaxID=3229679 RepID=UPI00354FCD8A